jgi:hypothetical protein
MFTVHVIGFDSTIKSKDLADLFYPGIGLVKSIALYSSFPYPDRKKINLYSLVQCYTKDQSSSLIKLFSNSIFNGKTLLLKEYIDYKKRIIVHENKNKRNRSRSRKRESPNQQQQQQPSRGRSRDRRSVSIRTKNSTRSRSTSFNKWRSRSNSPLLSKTREDSECGMVLDCELEAKEQSPDLVDTRQTMLVVEKTSTTQHTFSLMDIDLDISQNKIEVELSL